MGTVRAMGTVRMMGWLGITAGVLFSLVGLSALAAGSTSRSAFAPFFDGVNNPVSVSVPADRRVDMTPEPPKLGVLDQDVLQTCGEIGTTVRSEAFKQLLARHPDLLRQIQTAVGGELLRGRNSQAEFRDDLTAIWFDRQGFEHIFCGELAGAQKIGGLHYVGRYLQLQRQGIGGRLTGNARKEEVVPGVLYTLGVVIRRGDRTYTDNRKGYPYVSDARELLVDISRAFKLQGNAQGACLYTVQDADSGKSYPAVFVKDRRAIVTFYPDATPRGKACRS